MELTAMKQLVETADIDLSSYEVIYKRFHAHPELSNQELETSKLCAAHLSSLNAFTVHTNIGGHGLAGVLENGPGRVILLRADMDALPVLENTSLPYASTVTATGLDGSSTPVMHACGHDMHMTCLLAAAETLVKLRDAWRGTLVVLFQPAEERGTGAQAMVDDGLYRKIPVPHYILGQHIMGAMRAGDVGFRAGTIMAGADSMKITLFGKGGHGSQPHRTIDSALLAAHVVVRLQGVVSREVDYNDVAVLTVGSIQVGRAENIISDEASIGVDIRSVKPETRAKLLSSIKRIVKAECDASGCTVEPQFVMTRHFPKTENDVKMAQALRTSFNQHFGDRFDPEIPITTIAEDFPIFGAGQDIPSMFWHWGGVEPALWDEKSQVGRLQEDLPMNHSSGFAPVIHPTLQTGIDTLCVAALTFLDAT